MSSAGDIKPRDGDRRGAHDGIDQVHVGVQVHVELDVDVSLTDRHWS